jgi:hypothetical protein
MSFNGALVPGPRLAHRRLLRDPVRNHKSVSRLKATSTHARKSPNQGTGSGHCIIRPRGRTNQDDPSQLRASKTRAQTSPGLTSTIG